MKIRHPYFLTQKSDEVRKISANDDITDLAGKSVDVFIDFLPATKEDLQGMRMQDVRKVEYYDFPSDPRFQGKAHVVNFVMQK